LTIGRDAAAHSDLGAEDALLAAIVGGLRNKTAVQVGAAEGRALQALLGAGAEALYVLEPSPERATVIRTAFAETPAVHVLDASLSGQTLDALVAEGIVPSEVGLLRVDGAGSGFAVLQDMGRLSAAAVMIEYAHDASEIAGPAASTVPEVARLMAERQYSNAIVVRRHGQLETLHVNDAQTRPGDRGAVVFIHDSVFPQLSFSVFTVASAAQTRLIDRAHSLVQDAERQMHVVEDLGRKLDQSSVMARLELLDEQELALEEYCRVAREDGLWQWVGQQLGVLYQYPAVPFYVPDHYLRAAPLPAPPTISIVTPMLNSGQFIQYTLDSVLDQAYPALEYVVQDGGSTDDALGIVEGYRGRLARIESERDSGMAQAINRGFQGTTGELMAYLNGDDLLLPGTLQFVAAYFAAHPAVDVVYGHRVLIDADHAEVGRWVLPRHQDDVLSWTDYVPQETLFWRRSIWEKAGGAMDESFRFALDWDLLLRFRDAGARFVRLPRFLGAFRVHGSQKTATELTGVGAEEIQRIREREAGRPITPAEIRQRMEPYLQRHKIYHKMYRLGVLAY
jgi:GT2 family glycosyltransferase